MIECEIAEQSSLLFLRLPHNAGQKLRSFPLSPSRQSSSSIGGEKWRREQVKQSVAARHPACYACCR